MSKNLELANGIAVSYDGKIIMLFKSEKSCSQVLFGLMKKNLSPQLKQKQEVFCERLKINIALSYVSEEYRDYLNNLGTSYQGVLFDKNFSVPALMKFVDVNKK